MVQVITAGFEAITSNKSIWNASLEVLNCTRPVDHRAAHKDCLARLGLRGEQYDKRSMLMCLLYLAAIDIE